jgi:tRNA (guanine37-N1)-methyltransferase
MTVDLVTALPEVVRGPLESGVLGRALEEDTATVRVHDLRDSAEDPQDQIDDYPFGGGGGWCSSPARWCAASKLSRTSTACPTT